MENIKQNPKSTSAKILEVLGTMASRPSGLIGLVILIVAIWLEWLPGIVIVPTDVGFFELLPNIILPVVAISMIMTAHMARMVR